jgi:hypothetical protein
MFCILVILRLLNCVTDAIQVTEGAHYFPRGPHVAQLRGNRKQSAKVR